MFLHVCPLRCGLCARSLTLPCLQPLFRPLPQQLTHQPSPVESSVTDSEAVSILGFVKKVRCMSLHHAICVARLGLCVSSVSFNVWHVGVLLMGAMAKFGNVKSHRHNVGFLWRRHNIRKLLLCGLSQRGQYVRDLARKPLRDART